MDLNKVSLIGNLANEPEARAMKNGQATSRFRIATNYIWKDAKTKAKKETAEFHNVVAWGKLADVINQYLKKGSKVYLEGRLQNRSWLDKAGTKKYMTEVVAKELIMLGHRTGKGDPAKALAKEEVAVEDED